MSKNPGWYDEVFASNFYMDVEQLEHACRRIYDREEWVEIMIRDRKFLSNKPVLRKAIVNVVEKYYGD